jgi:hypothetical protein
VTIIERLEAGARLDYKAEQTDVLFFGGVADTFIACVPESRRWLLDGEPITEHEAKAALQWFVENSNG